MKANPIHPNPRSRHRRAGFSIVELLVVIAIIALLAGIMVPTVTAVKNVAKAGATKALLHSISTGLDMFKTEPKLGRMYPWSFCDTRTEGDPYNGATGNYDACGAQTLVWGLAGADLMGTPGFQPGLMHNDTDGLYERKQGKPVKPRFGPFIDMSKSTLKKPSELDRPVSGPGNFDQAPVIVDNFNLAILYYAPDPNYTDTRMFRYAHNSAFIDTQTDKITSDTTFGRYTLDKRAKELGAGSVPQNRESYLLISAGPDGAYGTHDDVTNFHPNIED